MKKIISLIFLIMFQFGYAKTWKVGPLNTYTKPSQVSALVSYGDSVLIDAGIYEKDVAKWVANDLVIKGVNGMAHLKSDGNAWGGKAIWVVAGNNTKIEYIEFSLCTVPDNNGAGIRLEGKNLKVSHCYFHQNENGILVGKINPCTLLVEFSEFGYNGFGDGFSHNLYIGNIDTLIFRYNYSHHAVVGHELKSRANINYILYNRLSNETTGTASRNIDLPNGGTTYLIGNIMEQGTKTQNSNMVGYGLEGLTNLSKHEIYIVNNTLINNRGSGSFFSFQTGTSILKAYNNILAGVGSFVSGNLPTTTDTSNNKLSTNINSLNFTNPSTFDFSLSSTSNLVINKGKNPGSANQFSLNPIMEYVHPNSYMARCQYSTLDIGAFEYCNTSGSLKLNMPKIILYPNPSNGNIKIESGSSLVSQISFYNLLGEMVYDNGTFNDGQEFNLSLHLGIYFYKVKTKSGLYLTGTLRIVE